VLKQHNAHAGGSSHWQYSCNKLAVV